MSPAADPTSGPLDHASTIAPTRPHPSGPPLTGAARAGAAPDRAGPAGDADGDGPRPRGAGVEHLEDQGLYRLLVASVTEYAIFALDPEGRILSWNAGAERLKGWTREEILGRHFSIFYPPEPIAGRFPWYELREAARVGRFEDEGWRVRKDGSRFWANVVITALRDEAGTLVGYAKVTRDLTERRAAQERALADARRLAAVEAANRARSEFLAALSHELRTPLNAIGGYTELIGIGVAGPVTEQQREYLAGIRGGQQHLLHLISDLLNYSRIEAGRVDYQLADVPVHAAVEEVLPLIEPQAAAKGVAIVHAPCTPDLVAHVDRGKAEQIVLNLLSNAVKFTPSGGRITLACRADGGAAGGADGGDGGRRVLIAVSDTGPGIAPEQQAAIFEPFVQLGRSLTSGHEGAGLGLAISRDLARAMGGDLTVASAVGAGSTFTLALPRR